LLSVSARHEDTHVTCRVAPPLTTDCSHAKSAVSQRITDCITAVDSPPSQLSLGDSISRGRSLVSTRKTPAFASAAAHARNREGVNAFHAQQPAHHINDHLLDKFSACERLRRWMSQCAR